MRKCYPAEIGDNRRLQIKGGIETLDVISGQGYSPNEGESCTRYLATIHCHPLRDISHLNSAAVILPCLCQTWVFKGFRLSGGLEGALIPVPHQQRAEDEITASSHHPARPQRTQREQGPLWSALRQLRRHTRVLCAHGRLSSSRALHGFDRASSCAPGPLDGTVDTLRSPSRRAGQKG